MGIGVIRHKIWHDLWENKGRTLRVVVIIAIGAFAVGAIFGGGEFILQDVARTWRESNPATIGLEVDPPVDDTMIETLENLREIDTAEGWLQERVQWRRSPADPWRPALLVALDDYEEQPIRQVMLDRGDWPQRREMGVQRGRELDGGDRIYLEIGDKSHEVRLNGVLYNAAHPPPLVTPDPMFFTTRERFAQLVGHPNYSLVLATIPNYSDARVEAAADLIQNELEKQDVEVDPAIPAPGGFTTRTSRPDRFVAQDAIDGVFLILNIMAVTTLILGLFLVYNTINALITQQVSQIGVMKAVGARFSQILLIYFSLVLIYALLALMIALPLGALGAQGLRIALVELRIKMMAGPFDISNRAVIVQIGVALLSPLLVAIIPIISGARITVREAVSTYGLGTVSGLIDRLLVKLEFIPRVVALTISNTFRNKKRVLLTQITLVGAGVIFMMVMNTRASVLHTFGNVLFSIFEVNVMLDLKQAERIKEIKTLTFSQPDVEAVEVWGTAQGTARLQGQPESNDDSSINLRGLPLPAQTYVPQMRAGRWLRADDDYAVVLNQELAEQMRVGVGDRITVDIPTKRESDWLIVGLLFEPVDQEAALVPRETLLREIRQVGRGKSIRVQIRQSDAASEAEAVKRLRALYERYGYEVQASSTDTASRLVSQRTEQMSIVLSLLGAMAVLIAVVGAVALSGTLSINVMERTREIGVMRAIGASALVVAGQFVGEGLILGWLSWLIAIPLSIPAGQLIINALSILINTELIYRVSETGILYWLAIITVLAIIASWFPAQKAAQTRVRESLAYT